MEENERGPGLLTLVTKYYSINHVMKTKGPTLKARTTEYISGLPQNNTSSKAPETTPFPFGVTTPQNTQNLQGAPGSDASPIIRLLPNIISFAHFQASCSPHPTSPGSEASSPEGAQSAQLSPPRHPPPIWLHLLPWLEAHTKPGVTLSSWAGIGGKGHRGGDWARRRLPL